MAETQTEYAKLGDSGKVRLTLYVEPRIKDELKKQAASIGVSASAYVSVLVGERIGKIGGTE